MELPIFNDNLKSSATWNQKLAQAQAARTSSSAAVRAEQVAQLARRAGWPNDVDDSAARSHLHTAAELVSGWAAEPAPSFGVERLLILHRTLIGAADDADVLRHTEPLPLNALHDPTPAILLPRLLDNAFDWFSTEGFNEMHAVEQAAVVFLRLLDLHPFPQQTELTALLAASFYVERAGLPPLFVFNDDITLQRYAAVTETAFRMLTQPLVEFFAEQLTRALQLSGAA
jgi:hypothetical protein